MVNFSGLISVMMPVYNSELYIAQAIRSMVAQTYAEWELIVVNDGSTDKSATIAARFNDPRVVLIHESNSGVSVARNTALRHMRGEYVSFLDADDQFLPNHLESIVGYLQNHPDMDAVYTDGFHIDGYGNRMQSLSSQRRGPFEGDIFEEVVRASDVFGPPLCVVLRRSIIEQYQLEFDPDITYAPHWDFFIQYSEVAQFGYLDRCTCLYRIHQKPLSVIPDSRNRLLNLARCREKAVKSRRFSECSQDTRSAVFYDLLVNLLTGFPNRQNMISEWDEFLSLPSDEQSRIYRLMASKAAARGIAREEVYGWLLKSRELNPADRRGVYLSNLYRISPSICRIFLQARRVVLPQNFDVSPFGSIEQN